MRRNIRDASKYAHSLLLSVITVLPISALAQVSQQPLSLTESVPPNMIFTLDDSGSMRWAFVPDIIGRENSGTGNLRNTRRGKSAYANPMYYDPEVTYVAPVFYNGTALDVKNSYSTSFGAAYQNGFHANRGSVNLASNYRVTWFYNTDAVQNYTYANSTTYGAPTGQIYNLAEHPAADFGSVYTVDFTLNAGTSFTTTITVATNAVSYTFTRPLSSTACNITVNTTGVTNSGVTCARVGTSGSTYRYTVTPTQFPAKAYYYKFNASLAGCDAVNAKNNDSCYQRVFVSNTSGVGGTDEQQNFANWYSFYRTRALATQSAATLAFSDLSTSTRLTWQDLGVCRNLDSSVLTDQVLGVCNQNKLKAYSNEQRDNFLDWIANRSFNSGTPLREALDRAGKFLKDTDVPWQKYPNGSGNTADNVYACRPSYHVMMTDGMWNGNDGTPGTPFNHDNSSFTLPDSKIYATPNHPYSDATNNTLADLAMHYWATDLKTTIDNDLPPYMKFTEGTADQNYWDPRNDPANWQHMTNFIMGLGLTNAMTNASVPWSGNSFSGTGYDNLLNGTAWPAATSGSDNNVYDLWHAALNSRGEFFSVDNPDAMVQAFKDILNRVAEREGTAASPSTTSGVLDEIGQVVSYSYQTSYESKTWSGDLTASVKERHIETDGSITVVTVDPPLWSAQDQLEAKVSGGGWGSRKIMIANAAGNGLQAFQWSNAGDPNVVGTLANVLRNDPDNVQSPCNSTTCAEQRLNFIRGDSTNEGSLFRNRQAVLGDMLASRPVSVRGARYLVNYANNIEQDADGNGEEDSGYQSYMEFFKTQEERATNKPRIYVGANDGMLHAFNVNTGEETFAFIPTEVFPNLYKLTGKTYSHHYYVDGSPVVADAYFAVGGEAKKWRTVLVGSLRAGGKGLFALDITDPDNISLLWEFDNSDILSYCGSAPGSNEDDCDDPAMLGYSFPQPTIARLHNGSWAVVTGNGYGSDGDRAGLLLIDLATGQLIRSPIKVDGQVTVLEGVPAVPVPVPNGLSTPRLGDMNVDGVADYAYAGDLQGNLWRFNLTPQQTDKNLGPFQRPFNVAANDKSYFKLSYDGKPLFIAKAPTGEHQPITAAPNIVRHPSRFGYLVIFGTGKYFEVTDKTGVEEQQSIYGIWDTNTTITTGEEAGPGNVAAGALTRSQLQEQEYVDFNASSDIRTLTQNTVKWAVRQVNPDKSITWTDNDGHNYGWYFDLPAGTGEMMVENMIVFGQSLFFQTLVPNDDPCGVGATTWTYAINTQTGGRPKHHIFKDVRDPVQPKRPVVGKKQEGPGGLALAQRPDGNFEICTGESCQKVDPDPESIGRQSWRRVGAEK